eukprot:1914426-Rhodomonas_salina.2
MQLITPFTVGFKELGAHLTRCAHYDDLISLQLDAEIQHAFDSTLTLDLQDLLNTISRDQGYDLCNSIVRWVHLSLVNGVGIEWGRIPSKPGQWSWGAALTSVKDMDIHWNQDEQMMRRTARALARNGYSNILSLPASNNKFCIPYGYGYAEAARHRIEQWISRLVSARDTMWLVDEGVRGRNGSRSRIEILNVVTDLIRDYTSFSAHAVSEFMGYLSISLEEN